MSKRACASEFRSHIGKSDIVVHRSVTHRSGEQRQDLLALVGLQVQ